MSYSIAADIRYLDGSLAGLVVPSGFRVTEPDLTRAHSVAGWVNQVRARDDFVRATGTGARYRFASAPAISTVLKP